MLLIPLVMVAFAALVVFAAVRSLKAWSARAQLRVKHPDEPWLWRPDWAQKAVQETGGAGAVVFVWFFAIVWLAISTPAYFVFRHRGYASLALVVLFLVAGAGMLCAAVYQTLRRRKYGASICRIDQLPIAIGRHFHGTIEARIRQVPEKGFRLQLTAVRRIVTGSGKHQSVSESILWQEEQTVAGGAATPTTHGARVPFHFSIPADARPCDERDQRDRVLWRLEVHAEVPGVDYHSTFELPVFRTGEAPETAPFAERPHAAPPQLHPSADSGIEVLRNLEGAEEILVGSNRSIGDVLGLILFLGIWFAAVGMMWNFGVPRFMLVIFSVIALFVTFIVLDLALGRSRIRLHGQRLEIRRTFAGLPMRTKVIDPSEVERIVPASGMRSGGRGYHDVVIHFRNGKTLKAARNIVNLRDAEALAGKLLRAVR